MRERERERERINVNLQIGNKEKIKQNVTKKTTWSVK